MALDQLTRNRLVETLHYLWMDEQKAQGFHAPRAHDEDETEKCNKCNENMVDFSLLPAPHRTMLEGFVGRTERGLATLGYEIKLQAPDTTQEKLAFASLPQLIALLRGFVGGLKHPKGIASVFPYEELARRILLRFSVPAEPKPTEAPAPAAAGATDASAA